MLEIFKIHYKNDDITWNTSHYDYYSSNIKNINITRSHNDSMINSSNIKTRSKVPKRRVYKG